MDTPLIFERGEKVYIVGPVAPMQPGEAELEEFAFADVVREQSPNELLLWLRGQYVESEAPNRNGQIWTSQELAIKSVTPRLMPVSVMHNPRMTVGLIADTKLLTPEADQVPRSRIDTALAVWKHRYPEVAEEAMFNYQHGTLMQSQECLPSFYECAECGKSFPKLPGGVESANWCSHLQAGRVEERAGAKTNAPRRLGDVTFTGTGLIFGSRGARGAFDKAHLDTFAEEVAEFHERAHEKPTRRQRRMEQIEIPRSEYDELKTKVAKLEELSGTVKDLEGTSQRVGDLEKQVEQLEVEKKKVDDELAAANTKIGEFEETSRAATLSSERIGKLGAPFKAKLPEKIKAKLDEQAKTLSDEDWTARLEELAEWTGVKPDEEGTTEETGGEQTFTREETSRAGLTGSKGESEPSRAAVSTVLGGLLEQNRPKPPEPAKR